ncbi:Hypothetical protein, putative, partial [Bodo saltans]
RLIALYRLNIFALGNLFLVCQTLFAYDFDCYEAPTESKHTVAVMMRAPLQYTRSHFLAATLLTAQRFCSDRPASQMPSHNPVGAHASRTSPRIAEPHIERYEKWATATGACSLDDLAGGATQAYRSLGVVLGELVCATKLEQAQRFPAKARIFNAVASM